MGMLVPTQYLYWFELVLIHLLVPGSSFFGHLCGIVAGILYVQVRSDTANCAVCLGRGW